MAVRYFQWGSSCFSMAGGSYGASELSTACQRLLREPQEAVGHLFLGYPGGVARGRTKRIGQQKSRLFVLQRSASRVCSAAGLGPWVWESGGRPDFLSTGYPQGFGGSRGPNSSDN